MTVATATRMPRRTSANTPEVSVIVVSYNTRDLTVDAIRSVFETARDLAFELIVVDNASTDGSAEAIEAAFPAGRYPELTLIRSPLNLGFAAANNLGAEGAKGDYILLLNPDTVVLDRAIQTLLSFARAHPEARIWGTRNLLGDGTLDRGSVWGHMSLWSIFCYATGLRALFPKSPLFDPEGYGGWERDTARRVDIVTGCFFLTDRRLWQELNGLDELFFMYAEEADYCLRAAKLGARPMFTPDTAIVHFGGAAEKVRADQITKTLAGKITLAEKHWSPVATRCAKALYLLAVSLRQAAFSMLHAITRKERFAKSRSLWRDVWSRRAEWVNGYSR